MRIPLPEQVDQALSLLHAAGFAAYVVGGCPRDFLLGRVPQDFDLATDARPEQTRRVFAAYPVRETGLKHGTLTVLLNGMALEVTTFRADSGYSDCRHPDQVRFISTLRDDLARRDFTVNALAYNGEEGLIDPFGGAADAAGKLVRCVGDPARRFTEDALRILRAVRFSSQLGFTLEPATKAEVMLRSQLLSGVAQERLAQELMLLLAGPGAAEAIVEYIAVLGVFIPELLPMKDFDQRNPHHCHDLLRHTAATVGNAPPSPPYLRLAALLHDVGKTRTFSVDEQGVGHFYGHAAISAEMAGEILRRLKFATFTIRRVTLLIACHDKRIHAREKDVRRLMSKLTPEVCGELLLLRRADRLAHNYTASDIEQMQEVERIAAQIAARGDCLSLAQLKLGGRDLLAMGYAPGPAVGRTLRALLQRVVDGEAANDYQTLADLAQRWLRRNPDYGR